MAEILILSSIAAIVAILGILAVWRCTKTTCKVMPEENAKNFVVIGVVFMVVGLVYAFIRGLAMEEITLFNIGVIFFIIGLASLAVKKYGYKRKRK